MDSNNCLQELKTMYQNLKQVFSNLGHDLEIDRRLLRDINQYVQRFLTKNENHISFFGDALVGVYPIKYVTEDKAEWFNDILEIDEVELKDELTMLESVDQNHKVTSDPTNLSMVWLVHKVLNTNGISNKDKERTTIEIISMLHYKFLSSLMVHYFPHVANKSIALATYTQLSNKFALKVHGSWGALVNARAEDILSKSSIHIDTLMDFNDDKAIQYVISDIQTRIRAVVKKIASTFHEIKDSDSRIETTSSTMVKDGDIVLKTRSDDYTKLKRYIHEIVTDSKDFIRDEILEIIYKAMYTMPPRHLRETLKYISDNYESSRNNEIQSLLDEVITYSFNYLVANKIDPTDLPIVISKLRTSYMSSRSSDESLMKIRKLTDEVVEESVKSRSNTVKASVRTGTLLYIVLRTLTMKYFGS